MPELPKVPELSTGYELRTPEALPSCPISGPQGWGTSLNVPTPQVSPRGLSITLGTGHLPVLRNLHSS